MKRIPKRAGEIVRMICAESGIEHRIVHNNATLHKSEALTVLTYIRTLKSRLDMSDDSGETDGKSD